MLVAIKNDAIEEVNEAVEGGKLIGRGVDVARKHVMHLNIIIPMLWHQAFLRC